MASTTRWTIGAVTVTSVVEDEIPHIPPELFFPTGSAAEVRSVAWLHPDYVDADGNIALRVQALVVDTPTRRILIDPCVGNGKQRALPFWHDQQYPWLERFAAAGYDAESIDMVLHTHLHADHVGWDTQLVAGEWVPTFTRARHLYTQAELDAARATSREHEDVWGDSIAPIIDAGLADVVAVDADLGEGLRLESTPGHTPGHVSLWIESEGQVALVSGDCTHHPVQLAFPDWPEVGDADPQRATTTRHAVFAAAAAAEALFVGTHYPTRPAGRVVADGAVWRFAPVDGDVIG